MAEIAQNGTNALFSLWSLKSEQKWKKRVNEKKNMEMGKSKENALIYMHVYIYTHLLT